MKLILPEQITEAQYKAYLADWGTERIVPSECRKGYAKMQLALALPIAHAVGRRRSSPAQTILKEVKNMTNFSKLVLKMTEYEGGCVERVNHFLKVFAFAKTIAEGEDVDDATKEILEAAAITHDIGIRVCFEKYGNCNGPHQEVEGPPIALEMLPACGYTHGQTERICYLIGHHHTYTNINGIDYQILVEADFLVNIFESGMTHEAAEKVCENIFRTKTGKQLLKDLFL